MAQSSVAVAEHRVRMPGAGAHAAVAVAGGGGGRADEPQDKGATRPEKMLNCFVRFLALIKRAGNALGTLAFTWATVVLLGGYPTVLAGEDFWFATVIVFLEALRMFGRNNRLDYQLFFHTRGALKPLGWSGFIIIVCLSNVWNYTLKLLNSDQFAPAVLLSILVLVVPGLFQSTRSLERLSQWLYHVISLWSPLVAILLTVPLIAKFTSENKVAKWIVFTLLLLVVLLLTGKRLSDHGTGNQQVFWRRMILNMCMFVSLVMLIFMPDDPSDRVLVFFYELYALVLVSFGSLQIPAAATRVVLSLLRLANQHYYQKDGDNNVHLKSTLNIFYGMVLGQGTLYVVACVLEVFSFIPRRLLARRGAFGGQFGVESVSLYYSYALEKSMEGDVLGPKKTGIVSFAMHFLDSDIPNMQLHGIRTMHNLLRREATRPRLLSRLTTSTKTMTRLIDILGWSGEEYKIIRLFAAKVIAELATSLRVIAVPGIVQAVSSLMDYGNQQKKGHPLLQDAEAEHKTKSGRILNANDCNDNQKERVAEDLGTGSQLETQDRSTQCGAANNENSWKLKWWKRISRIWSIPHEEQLTEDLLPALGMSILDGLASCDTANCVEISRETGLIPKIIDFTGYCNFESDPHQRVLVKSSVKLLYSLTGFDGEVGVTLRHKICKHPFLPRNLARILGDSTSSQEMRKLVAGIIRNLAIDKGARQAIGHSKLIISRLMHAFLTPSGTSSTDDDRFLRKVAGQALAMLAIDSSGNNCVAMLRETWYVIVKELTCMIHDDWYRCIAASLLRSFCLHARHELKATDLKELSSSLREVLERILLAEGAELEILIGLSSQISKAIPEEFARELEHGEIKEAFTKRLVDVLDANMDPRSDCPSIRRMVLEQVINLMEYNSRYVNCFNNPRMINALSMVEETMSEAENYNVILGDVGVMEAGEPLSSLVARAKQLLAVG